MTSGKRTRAIRQVEAQRQSKGLNALERRRRLGRVWVVSVAVVVVAVVGTVLGIALSGGGSTPSAGGTPVLKLGSLQPLGKLQPVGPLGSIGPEGVPIPNAPSLASTALGAGGQTVDGIQCQANEQSILHIHVHLSIFVNGSPRKVPTDIGILGAQSQNLHQGSSVSAGSCLYWLHTHDADGIIHIESPVQQIYTLGNFFDVWGQPLGTDKLGPLTGHVTALYNSKLYEGNPRNIPLNAKAQIQLEVGSPLVAPESIHFPNGL